ncbi:hypothetical protein NQ314_006980 [Rhamnusium bicolor]|uniref:Saposin B-type domain-containing protein n=1 Tax=Rhamnusium bicolor TaxID=1586634 RepID=A0AAV8YWJ2_9CUCU|nr:hypothetical protein NQ314_006980 [Rhamnusium bicolor]
MPFTHFLLYFTSFFISCLSCFPSSTYAILPYHMELIIQHDTYDSYDRCNLTLVAPKKVINPYKTEMRNFVPQKPFGSFYLKCTACLAVAHQIITTIESTIEELEIAQKCQEFINEKLAKKNNTVMYQWI